MSQIKPALGTNSDADITPLELHEYFNMNPQGEPSTHALPSPPHEGLTLIGNEYYTLPPSINFTGENSSCFFPIQPYYEGYMPKESREGKQAFYNQHIGKCLPDSFLAVALTRYAYGLEGLITLFGTKEAFQKNLHTFGIKCKENVDHLYDSSADLRWLVAILETRFKTAGIVRIFSKEINKKDINSGQTDNSENTNTKAIADQDISNPTPDNNAIKKTAARVKCYKFTVATNLEKPFDSSQPPEKGPWDVAFSLIKESDNEESYTTQWARIMEKSIIHATANDDIGCLIRKNCGAGRSFEYAYCGECFTAITRSSCQSQQDGMYRYSLSCNNSHTYAYAIRNLHGAPFYHSIPMPDFFKNYVRITKS